ncbi:hypothetical protein IWQ62_002568 [Dispira parvispora]|uniref:L,D-transpeptidase n=1 Tax=Dispira parvispora TaxID=1520584 RepID=A0A9W8AQ48_9FUNG|nr:hypothetical protein IWQ62_002568 [Dispira parvispora]
MRYKFTSSLLLTAFVALPSLLAEPTQLENNHVELHRREAITIYMFFSAFSEEYDDVNFKILPICEGDNIVEKRSFKDDFVNEIKKRGTGRYNTNEWFRLTKAPHDNLPEGCYAKTDAPRTSRGAELKPYTSIVTGLWGAGTKVYIPELEGRAMDNGQTHNGCVEVADELTSIDVIEFYVFAADRLKFFLDFNSINPVPGAECEVLNYDY